MKKNLTVEFRSNNQRSSMLGSASVRSGFLVWVGGSWYRPIIYLVLKIMIVSTTSSLKYCYFNKWS